MKYRYLGLALCLLIFQIVSLAQDSATVPDLTGLSLPEAAALLNQNGLQLGIEEAISEADGNGVAVGLITNQSITADTEVERGSTIDVGVVRSPNVVLLYDDNDFTLINTTNNVADVTGLRFVAIEGENPASFAASRWSSNVRENRCLQVWSIAARDSKRVEGCEDIQWLSTNTTSEHFWTEANGVETFAVVEDGIERAQCTAAAIGSQDSPRRCQFYLAGASSADGITQYAYFVYTPEALVIYNSTSNLWMPTDRTTIFNLNPNFTDSEASLILGELEWSEDEDIVADVTLLAPNQCLMLTAGEIDISPPQACDVIAQRAIDANNAFWLADFELDSATDNPRHTCPAAVASQSIVCIVPQ